MTYPHEQPLENDAPAKMLTFKFTLTDGTGGTYRSDSVKDAEQARSELMSKYGVKVATVEQVTGK